MHKLIKTFYAYNSWATGELIEAMQQLSPDKYTSVEASGRGSIHDTFAHYVNVQRGWFSWFDESLPMEEAYGLVGTADDLDTLEQAKQRWHTVDKQTRACIENLNDEQLQEVWSWDLPSGDTAGLPLWQLIIHVANHQTHTRAQIVAAVRRTGRDPGVYEFLAYAMQQVQLDSRRQSYAPP